MDMNMFLLPGLDGCFRRAMVGYMALGLFHIFHLFLHIPSYFQHVPSYSFMFSSSRTPSYFLHFFKFPSYSWDLEKFRYLPLCIGRSGTSFHIGSGTWKNSKLSSRKGSRTWKNSELHPMYWIWDLKNSDLFSYIWTLALGKNPSYIYGHEICFYCRDLYGNL